MPVLNVQNTSDHSTHLMSYLEKRFLDRLQVKFHFDKFGKKKSLAKNMGKTVTWTRWTDLSANTTALTEGETPSGQSLSSAQVTATVASYGGYASTSDFLILTAINDQLNDMVDLLGYQAGLSLDTLTRNEVDANGTEVLADSTNNSTPANVQSGTDTAKSSDLRKCLKTLTTANVEPFDDGFFKAIIHPIMEFDLMGETTLDSVLQVVANTEKTPATRGKLGVAYGIELFRSTNIRAGADESAANVYRNVIVGKDAYGLVDLESAGLQIITKPLGSGGTEDPLNQRATVGYKVYFVPKILEAARAIVFKAYGV